MVKYQLHKQCKTWQWSVSYGLTHRMQCKYTTSLQCRRFLCAHNLLAKVPCWNFLNEALIFFLPSPSPLSFFRPHTNRKGYYLYSPQSSTVIKSKMAATTILRTRTRFRPPKIRLHCRLVHHLHCLPQFLSCSLVLPFEPYNVQSTPDNSNSR